MPWPFSESIKKRACRYLLQRYLGHFLQEKLSLEQLSLDLYQGTGSLTQVPLDKWCLNEILESADAPLEVTDGFIQSISLSVPWGSLLQDNCALELKGLEMVFRPRPRLASGSEPMYWSSFMTSSMQLAKECLSQKLTDEQGEGSQPFEGLEKFAETIETVLRRVKVTFLDTVLRIEHVPENSKSGTALEIRIERTMYCDETADECSGINVHQPTAFAHKLLQLSGVSFFWDEFPASTKSSPVCSATQLATEPKLSPSWNPKITYEPHPQLTRNLPEITPSDPVQISKLIGRMDLSLTLKQNEVLPGAKLDVDGQIDSIHLFLSPRQVHLLLDMVAAIAGPESLSRIELSNKDRKNRPMQQEDEYRIQMELKRYLRKESLSAGASSEQSFYETETARTPSSREEEVFFSMAEMDMSHSLSSLPPLGDPPTMDLDLSLTSTYTNTPAGSPLSTTVLQPTWGDFLDRNKQELQPPRGSSLAANVVHQASLRRTSIPSRSVSVDESRPELLFRLTVGTFSVSVLHIDPLPPAESSLNHNPLTPMARDFFARIEKIEPVKYATEDFLSFQEVFSEACSHDHLRFIGTGIKVSYEQRQRSASRSFSTDLSIGNMEFLECLFSTDSHSIQPHYTELLTFRSEEENDSHALPCLQLHYRHSENRGPQGSQGRLSSVPQKAELQIKLSPVFCELDISIVDRLNSLLQPQKLTTVEMMASHMYTSYNKHINLHKAFTEVFLDDSHTPANCRVSVQVSAPALNLSVRFPIPDLRSDQERGPWFKKSLQKEILHLEFTDIEFKTEFIGGSTPEQVKLELTFKELTGSFEEDKTQAPVKFFQVSGGVDGDITSSDNFDWPRIVLKINPLAVHSILERIAAEEEEGDVNFQEEEEGGPHSLKDVCDIRRPEPSPFSSRRVMFENEEMVMPGDVVEMTEFQDKTINNSHYVLELMLPNIHLTLPNRSFYEKLYNRISNDLLLWEPTAPSPVETFENLSYGVGLSVASQLINTFSKDSFSQFKSAVNYDDESGSEEETLQYYSTVDPNYRSRRRKKLDPQNKHSQSFLSVQLNVTHGLVSIFTDVKQDDGKTLEGKYGEFWLEFNNGSLFSVTKYEGFEDRHYVCLHSSSLNLYHQGMVDGAVPSSEIRLPSTIRPHWLEPTICFSEEDGLSRTSSDGVGENCPNMLTVAVKIQSDKIESNTKEFLVAVGLRGATLQHRVLPSGLSWHEQILYFLNISDEPVLGYNPPATVTTFHVHLWSCALDYRPVYLPVRSLLTVETFSISSSVAVDKSYSTLRIILDEAALHLSDKCNTVMVNLHRDYVRVMDMGLLELTITTVKSDSDGERTKPRFELRCSSDVIHIRTCSDSCAALMNLIQYIASYGDLHPPSKTDIKCGVNKPKMKVESFSQPSSHGPLLAESEQQILRDLMSDAMEEIETHQTSAAAKIEPNGVLDDRSQTQEPSCSDLFLFPDESGNVSQDPSPTYASFTHHLINETVGDVPAESDDFCILFAPKAAVSEKEEEPIIKKLVDDAILIKENHFSQPVKKTDASKAPLHFPIPLVRYVVKEISLIWHLYGGRDFGSAPPPSPAKSFISPHSSPSHTPTRHGRSTACGGRGRNPDFLMEIQLSKVKFQHEIYPQSGAEGESGLLEQPVSRQIFIVQDLEIRDRLATSQMNKFLYLYCSKEMPRKAHSNMLTVKALHVRPESGRSPQECCLRVSLMPLRLNIDQDALFFLKDFFTSLSAEVELLVTPDPEVKKSPGAEVTCNLPRYASSLKDPSPVISFSSQKQTSENGSTESMDVINGDDHRFSQEVTSYSDQPVFFREFRFTSEVPIRLDYHGKHVSMDQGTLAGILIGLAQLNCSELKLKRLCYRHGLLGVDKLFSYAISEWLNDIKKNQLPGILGGVGPMHSLVQLVQGLKDLVWLPIEQYRKDGRIVRGFQRGAASFGTSTAMAALELTNRMVQTIQLAAETAYDMVSPGPTFIETKKIKRFPRHRLAHQPVDLREGVAKAYSVVKEGITDTAQTIYETAAREHENRGVTGAVAGASNPRKFSEKIALQKQRQAEETAAFEEVMMEICNTRLQAQKLRLAHSRGPFYSGSLPNVNQIGSGVPDFQGSLHSPLDSTRSTRHHGLVERVQRDPRRMVSPLRRYVRQIDSSPYGPTYLSPPPEPGWRRTLPWGNFPMEKGHLFRLPSALNRTNSDSALHTSVMNPAPQDAYLSPAQGAPPPGRRSGFLDGDADSKVFVFQVPPIEEGFDDPKHSLKPWDAKKLNSSSARPRSCEVPGIHIFPSPDQPANVPLIPSALNTGGSLPDLTNLHFPSPLPTPLDPDEGAFPTLSGGGSTTNLTTTMTHLGISGGVGLSSAYEPPGLPSPMQSSLSNPSLQSSLSNPNLQASLRSPPLHSSLSNPSLQSSRSSSSIPSSLSNQSLPSSLSSSLSNPSLPTSPRAQPAPTSPGRPSLPSFAPMVPASVGTSPRRRVPLSPLTLPMGGDARRQHPKQFSPTMSPTLSSIAQGVPLDTSKLPADHRLPPYPYSQAGLVLPSPQQKVAAQPPPLPPGPSARPHGPPGAAPQRGFAPQFQPDAPALQHPPVGQHGADFGLGSLEPFAVGQSPAAAGAAFHEDVGALYPPPESYDPHPAPRQTPPANCGRHGPVPNIVLTGDSPPGISKEIAAALAAVPGFEVEAALGLEEELRIEPLSLDGLQMLSDPYALLTDPSVEDSFRTDRLQ